MNWSLVEKTETCWLWRGRLTPYTEANTRWHEAKGYRYRICRSCSREASSKYKRARGVQPFTPRNAKTHCANGHEFTAENTWTSPTSGYRKCRACSAETAARFRERRAAAA